MNPSSRSVWEGKRISSSRERERLVSYRSLALASADSLAWPLAAVHEGCSVGASPPLTPPSRSLPLRSPA
ncbi:hypothetical protein GUJ93_ZPchr0010g7560 [Zizania palustris]|uniref:Uncharacterized protein n=1 Tax=Zizania palustris TaxID=103762 RepID=A0A8J5W835_ZIZPA|nr:hypothetical protein GUJ93_ZPchr0010g10753 [Zizania palustris]KAG8084975.1 hypothetical protein GUJ93_ZPchr0010g7560 [Zizania palustris]